MGTGNLTDVATDDIILAVDHNTLTDAFNGPLVGRNSSGVPTTGQELGTSGNPWGNCRVNALYIGGVLVTIGGDITSGMIMPFGGSTAPAGYFECNGANQLRATYSDLFTAIGTNYGNGDGSTTFTLPDFRGKSLRGWDHGAGNDPDAATRTAQATGGNTGDNVGSVQSDAFQGWQLGGTKSSTYYGRISLDNFSADASSGANFGTTQMNTAYQGDAAMITAFDDGTNGTPRTSAETRMQNSNVMYIIKT